MRKIFLLAFILFFAVSGTASASLNSDFTNHGAPAGNFYQSFFDVLALDLTIPDNAGVEDELNALTVKNQGTALNASNIEKVVLWADAGPEGFQGFGIDEELSNASWYDLGQYWYWSGLSKKIPVGGLRVFVSVETTYTFSKTTYIQMMVSVLNDQNQNSQFDLGDTGIFVASENDGPIGEGLVNAYQQNLYKAALDQAVPKTNITNLIDGQKITAGEFAITGKSKDQGGSIMSWVKIVIDGEEFAATTSDNYLNWQYVANFSAGEHTVKIKHRDQVGNQGETAAITITAEAAVAEPEPEPTPAPLPEIIPGNLIKGSLPSVYYYSSDGKRYVFPNEKTYKTWYADFSSVKTITDDALAGIAIGGNVTYRPGVKMVKITTDPKVYAVAKGGVLRWVKTEAAAQSLYGENWNQMIEDVPDAFFTNYTVGTSIEGVADYNPETVKNEVTSIADNKIQQWPIE